MKSMHKMGLEYVTWYQFKTASYHYHLSEYKVKKKSVLFISDKSIKYLYIKLRSHYLS